MALLKQAKSSLMKNKDEALLTACSKKKGLKEASDLILNHGADINFRNDELQTPLHLAAMHGNSNITKLLIRQNANVDAKDVHYRTPLHFAARNGQLTDIKLLVRGNAALHRDMLQKYPGESFEPHVSEFLRKRTIQLIEKSYHGVKLQYNEIETNPGGIPQAETAPGPLDSMPEEVDNFGRGGLLPRAFSRSGREVSTSSDNLVQRLFRNHNKSKSTSGKEAFGGKKKGIMIAQFADESDRSSEASINEIEKAIIIQSACRCYLARCRAVKKWVEQSTFHEYLGNESKEDTDKIMLKQMPTHLSQFNHARERSHKLGHEMETNRKLLEWVETGLSDIQKMEQSMGQSLLMGSVSAEDAKENEVSQNIENAKDMLVALKSRAMAQFLRDTASDKPATEQKRSRSHTRNSSMESFDSGFGDTGLLNTDVKSFLLAQSHRKLDADISLESQMEQALAKLASAQAKFDEAQRLEKELEKRRKQAIEDLQRYTANIRNLKQSAKNIALEDGLESIILLLHDAEEEIIKLRTKVKDAKSVIEVQEIVEAGSKIIYESTSSVSKSMVQKVYESDEEDSTLQKKMLETRETLKAMSGKIKQLRVFATEANIGGSLQAMAKIVTTIRKASEGLNELDSKIEDCISNEELESILNKGKSLLERATTNVHFWVKKATSSESDEIRNLDIAEEDEESRTRLRSRSTRSRSMTRSTSVVAEEARLHRKSSFSSISAKREGIMQAYFRRKSKSQDQPRLTRRKSDSQVKAGFLKSYFNKKSKSQNGSTFLKYGEEQEPISRPISRSTSLHLPTAAKTDFIQETQLQESSDNKSLNHHKVENSKEGQPRRARMKKPDDLANSSILKAFFRFSTDKSIKERLADARSEGTSVVLADSQLKDESVSADTAQESNLSAPSQAANVPLSTNCLPKESSKELPDIAPIYTVHGKDDRGEEKDKAISSTAEELQETNDSEPDAAAFWQDAGMQPNQTHLACHSVSRIKILWNRLDHCLLQSENMKDMGRAGKVQAKVSDLKSDLRDMLSGVLSDKKLMRLGSSTMKLEKQIQNEMRLERPLKKHAHDRRQPAFEESPVSVLEASASRSAAEDDELFEGYDQQQSSQLKYFVLPSSSIEHAATFSKASPPLGEVAVQSPNYHAKTKTEEQKAKDFKRLLKITALLATALLAFAVAYGFGSSTVEPPLQGVKVSQRIKQFGENTKLFLQKQTESAAQAAQEMVHMHKEITSHTSAAFQKQTEKVSQNAQDLVKMQKEKAAKAATKIQKHSEKAAQKAQEKASKAASKIQQHTEKASQNTQEMIKKHKDKVAEVGSTIVQKHNEKMEKIQIDASSFEKYHFIH